MTTPVADVSADGVLTLNPLPRGRPALINLEIAIDSTGLSLVGSAARFSPGGARSTELARQQTDSFTAVWML